MSKITDAAVHDALNWLRAALDCKNYHWDADQREAAELAYAEAVKNLSPSPAGHGDALEAEARRMFEAQADKHAAPWEQQWEPTKKHWRSAALVARQPVGQEPLTIKSVRQFIAARSPNEEHREDVLSGDYDHTDWFAHVAAALAKGNNS